VVEALRTTLVRELTLTAVLAYHRIMNQPMTNGTSDRRDLFLKAGCLTLVWVILGCLWMAVRGGSVPASDASYAALADRMNDPALAGQCEFEAQNDGSGILICYIDRAWRQATPAEQRHFALSIADRWAALTGNPNALVCFGTGHGAFFAFAASRSRVDGMPFFRPLEISLPD
jgi:hypothetical protein